MAPRVRRAPTYSHRTARLEESNAVMLLDGTNKESRQWEPFLLQVIEMWQLHIWSGPR